MEARIFAVALGATLFVAQPGVAADATTIKFGSFVPPKSGAVRTEYIPWLEAIERDAEGALEFQTFWGGALSRSPRKQYELMINGIQDGSLILPSYTQKLFPDFSLFALPGLFRDATEGSIAQWRMYEQGLIGGLDKVYVAAVFNNGNSALHFSEPIRSAADIMGLKIRAAGPGEAAVIKALGGVPVGMSITQVAESLNRGVIQGTLNGWNANKTFRFDPLIRSDYDEPLGVRSFFLGFTKKVHDRLPAKAKRAIEKNSGLVMSRRMGRFFARNNEELRRKAMADPQRNVISHTAAEREERFRAVFKPFHDRWIETHEDGERKYKALQKILAELRKST